MLLHCICIDHGTGIFILNFLIWWICNLSVTLWHLQIICQRWSATRHFLVVYFLYSFLMWTILCWIWFRWKDFKQRIVFHIFFFSSNPAFKCTSASKQVLASQKAAFSKPPPSTTNHVTGGGNDSSPEEVEVLLTNQKAESHKPSFLRAIIRGFGPYFLIGSAFKVLQDVITFINPQLLR